MGILSSSDDNPVGNVDQNDIVHSGVLDGLQDYTVFRLRYPKRRTMRTRLLTDWYIQEASSGAAAHICLVGNYKNNIIRTSAVIDIQTNQRVVTANCVYILGKGCKVHEHDVGNGLNKLFINGFPFNWREAVHQAFNRGAGAGSPSLGPVSYSKRYSLTDGAGRTKTPRQDPSNKPEDTGFVSENKENGNEDGVKQEFKDEQDISEDTFENIIVNNGSPGTGQDGESPADPGLSDDGTEMLSSLAGEDYDILPGGKNGTEEGVPASNISGEDTATPHSAGPVDGLSEHSGSVDAGFCAEKLDCDHLCDDENSTDRSGSGSTQDDKPGGIARSEESPAGHPVDTEKSNHDLTEFFVAAQDTEGDTSKNGVPSPVNASPERNRGAERPVQKRSPFMTVEEALRNTPFYKNRLSPVNKKETANIPDATRGVPETKNPSEDAPPRNSPGGERHKKPSIKIMLNSKNSRTRRSSRPDINEVSLLDDTMLMTEGNSEAGPRLEGMAGSIVTSNLMSDTNASSNAATSGTTRAAISESLLDMHGEKDACCPAAGDTHINKGYSIGRRADVGGLENTVNTPIRDRISKEDAHFNSSPEDNIRPNFSLLHDYICNSAVKTRTPAGGISRDRRDLISDADRFRRISLSGPFSDVSRADDEVQGTKNNAQMPRKRSLPDAVGACALKDRGQACLEPGNTQGRISAGSRGRSAAGQARKELEWISDDGMSPADCFQGAACDDSTGARGPQSNEQCMSMEFLIDGKRVESPEETVEMGMDALDALPDMVSFDDIVRNSPLSASKRISIRLLGNKSKKNASLVDLKAGLSLTEMKEELSAAETRQGPTASAGSAHMRAVEREKNAREAASAVRMGSENEQTEEEELSRDSDNDSLAASTANRSSRGRKMNLSLPKKKRKTICRFSKK